MIQDRQKTSAFWYIVHRFGSLGFAVILLLTIAAATGGATLVESVSSTAAAQYYVYRNPFFLLWLVFLILNLACAALTRWPWQFKHLGFVVTHAGIILLLLGGAVGRWLGFEAFVTLRSGQPGTDRLHTRQTVLLVSSPQGDGLFSTPIELEVSPPSAENPLVLSVPGSESGLQIRLDGASERLQPHEELVNSGQPGDPPGILLRFRTAMMGQNLEIPLLLGTAPDGTNRGKFDFFGRAELEFVPRLPPEPPVVAKPLTVDFREARFVLAKAPNESVTTSTLAQPTDYAFELAPAQAGQAPDTLILTTPDGDRRTFALEDVIRKATPIAGTEIVFEVPDYFPDFAVREGKVGSLSNEPNNPAVAIILRGKIEPPIPADAKPRFELAPTGDPSKFEYRTSRAGTTITRGIFSIHEPLALGWADWEVTIEQAFPQAGFRRDIREAPPHTPEDQTAPGVRAWLVAPDGTTGPPTWIMARMVGQPTRRMFLDNEMVDVGLDRHPIQLPFSVRLDRFEVPRDPGTDQPSDFISHLIFKDKSTGLERRDTAHMNYPAMFPGDFWRSLMGWNYKFSQAGWDNQDLDMTQLQVLYDPGWPLKWVGSLLLCAGIAIMFYFKPYSRRRNPSESTSP
jgi:hypothetical protein